MSENNQENGHKVRLESLDITGFKSFGEKTHLDIESGITAVVGPNGCGKSNISDAISWVLGEQSVRNLRAKKIEDLIFNGSSSRKPQGMAEVTVQMVSSNGDEEARYKVCRRLYRSGESDFEINGKACRLKDIRDLFIEMGVGVKSYSIIEQGKIDLILSPKAADRRVLFEEAAGISKFKIKRHQTLLKLQSVKQNLIRLNDIIQEVGRQLRSIKRQAGKARRYQRFSEELKKLSRISKLKSYNRLNDELAALSETTKVKEDEKTRSYTAIALSEASLQEMQEQNMGLDLEIKSLRDRLFDAKLEIERVENRISMLTDGMDNNRANIKKNKSNIESLEQEILEGKDQLRAVHELCEEMKNKIIEKEQTLRTYERDKLEQEKAVAESESIVEDLRESCFNSANDVTDLKNRVTNCGEELVRISKGVEKLTREEEETAGQLRSLFQELESFKEKREAEKKSREEKTARLSEKRHHFESLDEEKRQCEERLTAVKEKFSSMTQRLESLLEMERSREGFEQGVKSILFAGDHGQGFKINRVLLDVLDVEEGLENAVENTLRGELQFALAETVEEASNGIRYLHETKRGCCSFLVQELADAGQKSVLEETSRHIRTEQGVMGPLSAFVKLKEEGNGAASFFLDRIFLCRDLEVATRLSRAHPALVFITPEGDKVECGCIFYGGAANDEAEGFLALKRKKQQIAVTLDQLKIEKNRCAADYEEKLNTLKQLEEEQRALSEEIENKEKHIFSLDHQIERIEEKTQYLEKKKEVVVLEKDQLEGERQDVLQKQQAHQEELGKKEALRIRAEEEMSRCKKAFQERQRALETLQEMITELRLDLTKSKEQVRNFSDKVDVLKSNEELALKKKILFSEEIDSLEKDIRKMGEEKVNLNEKVKESLSNFDILKSQLGEKENHFAEKKEAIDGLGQKLKELRKFDETLGEALKALQMKKVALETGMNDKKAQFLEAFNCAVEDCDVADDDMAVEEEKLGSRISELKAKIEKMGQVNLVAFDEYQELEKRYNFLMEQQKDILESRDALKKVLTKLEKTSEELFARAFEEIRKNFKRYFTELFGEGKAELQLTQEEGEEDQEKGIDIILQPPGKKAKNILQLSGGEKTLGALALLFAIFEYGTAPFCVLDEADAALDDLNIDKFSRLLSEFQKKTQFILITHNKRTMKMASKLYGITMEEPGISKVLSVRLQ